MQLDEEAEATSAALTDSSILCRITGRVMSGTFVIILMQMSASMSMKSASQSSPAYLDQPPQFSS